MDLAYMKTLQRGWDRYSSDEVKNNGPHVSIPRSQLAVPDEVKLQHLQAKMEHDGSIVDYEKSVGIPIGSIANYSKWLVAGRFPTAPENLLNFYISLRAANAAHRKGNVVCETI